MASPSDQLNTHLLEKSIYKERVRSNLKQEHIELYDKQCDMVERQFVDFLFKIKNIKKIRLKPHSLYHPFSLFFMLWYEDTFILFNKVWYKKTVTTLPCQRLFFLSCKRLTGISHILIKPSFWASSLNWGNQNLLLKSLIWRCHFKSNRMQITCTIEMST